MSDNIANDRFVDRGVQPINPANRDVLEERVMRRSTIWRRCCTDWKIGNCSEGNERMRVSSDYMTLLGTN